jgi:hypothetical protein
LPVFVTSDLEIIQEIFIKQYANFSARKRAPLAFDDDHPSLGLFSATRSRWKRMRVIMNPTFSTAKLREVFDNLFLYFLAYIFLYNFI